MEQPYIEIQENVQPYCLGHRNCHYTYAERIEIRRRYKLIEDDLIKGLNHGADVFFWKFSTAELLVWTDLRFYGFRFFPQFPIRNYFVDFASPAKKIVLEVDGAQWHQDKEKDLKRQTEIEEEGYSVIRIPAVDVFKYNPFPQINHLYKMING